MPVGSVRLHGLAELQRALKKLGSDEAKRIDVELREIGSLIAEDARQRFSAIDVGSASGFRARTKGFGRVVVEQQKRKRTGRRPDYGALQMTRALIPARSENVDRIVERIDHMLARLGGEGGF